MKSHIPKESAQGIEEALNEIAIKLPSMPIVNAQGVPTNVTQRLTGQQVIDSWEQLKTVCTLKQSEIKLRATYNLTGESPKDHIANLRKAYKKRGYPGVEDYVRVTTLEHKRYLLWKNAKA